MDTSYLNNDNSINMCPFASENYQLETFANQSLQLNDKEMDLLIDSINHHLNMTMEQQRQITENYDTSSLIKQRTPYLTDEFVPSNDLRAIQTINNRLTVLRDSTYIPINRKFNIEIDGNPLQMELTSESSFASATIHNYEDDEFVNKNFITIGNQTIHQLDLCLDLINSYNYIDSDNLHELDNYLSENGPLTDNLKNALQEYKNNKNVSLQNTNKYDQLDSYEKLLNFEGLDDELQK